MKIPFKLYIHDEYGEGSELREYAEDHAESAGRPEIADAIEEFLENRPFYEVTLGCECDSETGEIQVVSFNGKKMEPWTH